MAKPNERSDSEHDRAHPETRRRKETRERLLAAALEVFAQTGVAAASIEQISETAGYTRGAFYSNFSAKEDLLLALLAQEQHSAIWQAESALGEAIGDSRPDTVEDLISAVLAALTALPDCSSAWLLMRRELELSATRDSEVASKLLASENAMYDRVALLLDETLERVGRRALVSSSDLARLVVAAFESSEQERLLGTPDAPPASGLFSRTLPTMLLRLTEQKG